MALLLDNFIIDGTSYDWLPITFNQITNSEYGVRSVRYPTMDLSAQVITNTKAVTNTDQYADLRKIQKQAWVVEFDTIDQCMYDHLQTLYTCQKSFYVQFDDEMSRDNGALIRVGQSGKTFFTPTYPVRPYGYYPGFGGSYANAIKIYDGTNFISLTSGFTISQEIGRVEFDNPIIENLIVAMSYTWRCFVRIAGFELKPRGDIPQGYYNGSLILEQVSTFDSTDPWITLEPCYIRYTNNTASPVTDIPSYIQDPSLPGSSDYITPVDSGGTAVTPPPTDIGSSGLPTTEELTAIL